MPIADLARLLRLRRAGPAAAFADEVLDFEGFGYQCEFGFVQRHVGAEPLGLFRFTFCEIAQLTRALDDGLAPYGDGDDLEIFPNGAGCFVCRSKTYGFFHTAVPATNETDPQSCLKRETRKIAYLKKRLLETLEEGRKIVVRRSPPDESPADVDAFVKAVRRYGPSPVLIVKATERADTRGAVRSLGDGVFEAEVPHFVQGPGRPFRMDLDTWLKVCRNAHALVHGREAPTAWRPMRRLSRKKRSQEHVVGRGARPNAQDMEVFGVQQRTRWFTPGAVHTFSAWVYVPSSFEGTRVSAALAHYRRGWRDADLEIRDAWQRVWVSAEIPADHASIVVGLIVSGRAGGRIWSLGWEIEAFDVPTPRPQPVFRPA